MQNPASALLSQVSSSGGGLPGRLDLERDSRRSYFGGGISGSWAWEAGFGMPDVATPSCLACVAAHPLGLCQNVAFHGGFELGFSDVAFEIELGVEGEDFEIVAMRLARRR